MEWLCLDFLNSEWRDWRGSGRQEDRLDQLGWLTQFLGKWGLEAPLPPDPEMRSRLGELRQRMLGMVEAIVEGGPVEDADLEAINLLLEQVPTYSRLIRSGEAYSQEQVALARGWPLVMGRIAASFADMLAGEDLRRLKICANEDCRWVFFDQSRNRTARWCDDRMCGNLMKVRRFRERQKAKGTKDG
ncbi:CGNR zinc finger domain-containing protein [Brevibacillus humidisoli]|uniref:CGNR zinc finger domain-containing protein n=1 Tax=Brevibacillus humidisoli TaxID=2895522 RepID=UPI001E3AAEA9|nr:CGNR zinc finger domain-containing protein [Brevibacillus humidisoli]UFJ41382.1 CGNR zinc finger domain-containing protein [Brevibacillus humidisoli]